MYVTFAAIAVYVLPLLAALGFVAACIGLFKDLEVDHPRFTIQGVSPILIRRGGWLFAFSLLAFALVFRTTATPTLLYLAAFTAIPAVCTFCATIYRNKGYQLVLHDKDLDRAGGRAVGWSHLMATTWVLVAVCAAFALAAIASLTW